MSLMKVRYKGIGDIRTITKKEFAGVGVVVDNDVTWDRSNGYAVVLDVNERMEEVLRGEQHFSLSAQDDAGGEKVVATASDPAAQSNSLRDETTDTTSAPAPAPSSPPAPKTPKP